MLFFQCTSKPKACQGSKRGGGSSYLQAVEKRREEGRMPGARNGAAEAYRIGMPRLRVPRVAGPLVSFRAFRQTNLQGIALNIASNPPEVLVVFDDARIEAVLPDSTGLIQFAVEVLGIHLIGQSNSTGKRGFRLWHYKQVYMVVHQAICPDLKVMF
jgi:hypothetical protein